MSVEVVVTGVKCSLGEGPHWEVDKEALIYLDSVNGDIMRWTPDTKRRETIHLGPLDFLFASRKGVLGIVMSVNNTLESRLCKMQSHNFTDVKLGPDERNKNLYEGKKLTPPDFKLRIVDRRVHQSDQRFCRLLFKNGMDASTPYFDIEDVMTGATCGAGNAYHSRVPDFTSGFDRDNKIGSVVPCEAGGYLIGLGRTIAHVNWETQQVTKQYLVESVGADDRFNDGKCDSRGRFWTGTMGKRISNLPTYERHVGALYSLNLEGILNRHLDKLDISNGLSWSADNRTMFYTDTVPRKIYAFDYDINLGTISSQRVAVDMAKFRETKTMGYPDGMTIDTNDHLWVTCFGFGKVICFDPNTGQQIRTVTVPVRRSTSCCFGGKGLDELYVTSASEYATEQELQGYPDSGSLFKITGLGVKGHPANVYRGKLQKQKL